MNISLPRAGILLALFGLVLSASLTVSSASAAAQHHASAWVLAASQSGSSSVPMNPSHPERYVVKRGDTLWDIAGLFLREPWYWPEIWYVNPQIANPHLIYPGDVLTLVYVDGQPQLRLERGRTASVQRSGAGERLSPRVREEGLEDAIPTIPYEDIAPFLTKGGILPKEEINQLPEVVALRGHLIAGAGHEFYAQGLPEDVAPDDPFVVVRIGGRFRDPETRDVLGYEVTHVGDSIVSATSDPVKLFLTSTSREALEGDRLIVADYQVPMNFFPRAPEGDVNGQIISVLDGVSRIGQYQVVVLNRGKDHGLDAGHVLAVWQNQDNVRRYYSSSTSKKIKLPDEHAGTLMIVKPYERISYALVMEANAEMRVLDRVRNPD